MGRGKIAATVVFVIMPLFVIVAQLQTAENDRAEIEGVFGDFSTAWGRADLELMETLWWHDDDVRFIFTLTPGRSGVLPSGHNMDIRGWDMVKHGYEVYFNEMHVTGRFENVVIDIEEDEASATFDSEIRGVENKSSVVQLRKKGSEWKIYMCDFDATSVTLAGNEGGEYVEIAFEAENGEGVESFMLEDADASGGIYVTGAANCFSEFSIPQSGEYAVWCRTHARGWPQCYYSAKLDDIEFAGWGANCREWAWSQLNQEGIKGPKIFSLDAGKHNITFSSPIVPRGHVSPGGCRLDALYITDNLSLRADQIQRRFDLTIGYIADQTTAEANTASQNMLPTKWGEVKSD